MSKEGLDLGDSQAQLLKKIEELTLYIIKQDKRLSTEKDRNSKLESSLETIENYVFDSSYRLLPLQQVEKYIQSNRHLPDVPSAADVEKEGLDLGDNQALLLKKIEELTLYIIGQDKELADEKKLMLYIACLAMQTNSFTQTLQDVTTNGSVTDRQITVQTANGGAMFTGRQIGSGYYCTAPSGAVFHAVTDATNLLGSHFFSGYHSSSGVPGSGVNT